MHLNHWWLEPGSGSGKPTQVPEETVRLFPVALVPETAGLIVADGVLVTAEVEAVNLSVEATEFVAVTLAIRCFPASLAESTRVLDVAPVMAVQPVAAESPGEVTELSQLNH